MSNRYSPDLRRNIAIERGKNAFKFLRNKEFKHAVEEYEESNAILNQIIDDSFDISNFDLSDIVSDYSPEEIVEKIVVEAYRDLSINYENLSKAYYFLKDYDLSRKQMELAEEFNQRYLDFKKTIQAYRGKASNFFTSMLFNMYMKDGDEEFDYLSKYFPAMDAAIRNGLRIDEEIGREYIFALRQYLELIEDKPTRGEDALEKLVSFTYTIGESGRFELTSLWLGFAIELLKYCIENNPDWTYKNSTAKSVLLDYILNCLHVLVVNMREDDIDVILSNIVNLQNKLTEKELAGYLYNIYQEAVLYDTRIGNYEDLAKYLKESIKIVENNMDLFTSLSLERLYENLLPALAESGQNEEAAQLYNYVLSLIDSLEWNPRFEEMNNLSEDEFEPAILSQKAEIYFNMAMNEYYLKHYEQSQAYFKEAEKHFKMISKDYYKKYNLDERKNKFAKVRELLYSNTKELDLKDYSKKINQLADRIVKNLDHVFGYGQDVPIEQAREYGLEAAKLLKEFEEIPEVTTIIDPNQLLKYYFFTFLLLDRNANEDLVKILFKDAVKLEEYENQVDPVWMASILNDATTIIPENGMDYLTKALKIIEKNQALILERDSLLIADVYFNYAVFNLDQGKFDISKDYAEKAKTIYELGQNKGKANIGYKLDQTRELIHRIHKYKS